MNAQTNTGSQRSKRSQRQNDSDRVLTQEELRRHWPFDRLDPSRFPKATPRTKDMVASEHEPAPF